MQEPCSLKAVYVGSKILEAPVQPAGPFVPEPKLKSSSLNIQYDN